MPRKARLWILILAGLPVTALVVMTAAGALLVPREHSATSLALYPVSAESLWTQVTDFPAWPAWRPDVKRMERLEDRDGHPVWLEVGPTGELPFEVVEWTPPRRLITRIADPDLPFGGSWTYEITSREEGSELCITEDGFIKNPVFRLLARFAFGYHSTMDGYLTALGRRFGVVSAPEHGPRPNPGPTGS